MRERFTDNPGRLKTAAGVRREIPSDFKYNPKKLKHLKKILHNVTVSLGTMTSSLNEFSKLKGPEVSPDGLLGGVGYIIPLKEIKETFNSSIRNLSDVADCLADELTNPRWDVQDDKDVKKLIKEKEEVLEDVEDAEEDAKKEDDDDLSPDDLVTVKDLEEDTSDKDDEESAVEKPDILPDADPDTRDSIESKVLRNASAGEEKFKKAVQTSLVNFFQ